VYPRLRFAAPVPHSWVVVQFEVKDKNQWTTKDTKDHEGVFGKVFFVRLCGLRGKSLQTAPLPIREVFGEV
jgi:hypothetical protein